MEGGTEALNAHCVCQFRIIGHFDAWRSRIRRTHWDPKVLSAFIVPPLAGSGEAFTEDGT
jgi:hypothetical protein